MTLISALALAILFLSLAPESRAAEISFPAQVRLFVGNTFISPTELNDEMSAQGLNKFTGIPELGIEITYPLLHYLDVGMRYSRMGATVYTSGSTVSTTNRGDIRQDSLLLLARVPFVRTSLTKFDFFAGAGGSNTSFDITAASGTGSLTKKASAAYWFAAPYVSAGVSAGIGYNQFFGFLEAGYNLNKVSSLTHSGSISGSVNTINLSGPYVLIGVLFDGVSATKR